jgi:TonB family protein
VTITLESHEPSSTADARAQRHAYAVALLLHVAVLTGLVQMHRSGSMHVGEIATRQNGGIEAFVVPSQRSPVSTSVPAPVPKKTQPAPKALARETQPKASVAESPGSVRSADTAGAQTTAPIRLGSGEHLGLVKKVNPVYPALMQSAGVEGTVVLDAVIHRDGTIGDIMVLKSSAPAFERAAIDAVKQWRYTPLPYEGIVTVTVNFSPRA